MSTRARSHHVITEPPYDFGLSGLAYSLAQRPQEKPSSSPHHDYYGGNSGIGGGGVVYGGKGRDLPSRTGGGTNSPAVEKWPNIRYCFIPLQNDPNSFDRRYGEPKKLICIARCDGNNPWSRCTSRGSTLRTLTPLPRDATAFGPACPYE